MAKAKKTKKPTVKVQDLKAKADPKGGTGKGLTLSCAAGKHIIKGQL
jgi:hypothetical protein